MVVVTSSEVPEEVQIQGHAPRVVTARHVIVVSLTLVAMVAPYLVPATFKPGSPSHDVVLVSLSPNAETGRTPATSITTMTMTTIGGLLTPSPAPRGSKKLTPRQAAEASCASLGFRRPATPATYRRYARGRSDQCGPVPTASLSATRRTLGHCGGRHAAIILVTEAEGKPDNATGTSLTVARSIGRRWGQWFDAAYYVGAGAESSFMINCFASTERNRFNHVWGCAGHVAQGITGSAFQSITVVDAFSAAQWLLGQPRSDEIVVKSDQFVALSADVLRFVMDRWASPSAHVALLLSPALTNSTAVETPSQSTTPRADKLGVINRKDYARRFYASTSMQQQTLHKILCAASMRLGVKAPDVASVAAQLLPPPVASLRSGVMHALFVPLEAFPVVTQLGNAITAFGLTDISTVAMWPALASAANAMTAQLSIVEAGPSPSAAATATTPAVVGYQPLWPTNLTMPSLDDKHFTGPGRRYSAPAWHMDLPSRRHPRTQQRFVTPAKPSFYPPAVAVLQATVGRALERSFLLHHMKELRRVFRRLIVMSLDESPISSVEYPLPLHCFSKAPPTVCVLALLQRPIVVHSGGLLYTHADTFLGVEVLFAGTNLHHVLSPRQTQGFDQRNPGKRLESMDGWGMWNIGFGVVPHSTRLMYNRVAALTASYMPQWIVDNTTEVISAEESKSLRAGRFDAKDERTDPVTGLSQHFAKRLLNAGDVLYLPDRSFSLAVALLEAMAPVPLSGETYLGNLARMIEIATGGDHRWDSVPPSDGGVEWRSFAYAGCCCCTASPSDIASSRFAAGHKVRLRQQKAVETMTKRLTHAFDEVPVATIPFEGVSSVSYRDVEHLWPPGGVPLEAVALHRGPSNMTAAPDSGGGWLVVAPLSRQVHIDARKPLNHAVLHAPNAYRCTLACASGWDAGAAVVVRTGVTSPTPLYVNGDATAVKRLNEGSDEVRVQCPAKSAQAATMSFVVDTIAFETSPTVSVTLPDGCTLE